MKLENIENTNLLYVNWLAIILQLIQPKNLFLVAGRGSAKTTMYMAQRSIDIQVSMPHSQQVIIADTYVNALTNIVPTLIDGWRRKGWKPGIDFVTDVKPPSHFKKCYKNTDQYNHTISTKHGVRFIVGSLDQPRGLAGNSFQHLYGDEARQLNPEKTKRIYPALRGEVQNYQHSPFYCGQTFFTDMPNILSGDYDWILETEKEMDKVQIQAALELGTIINDLRIKEHTLNQSIGISTDTNYINRLKRLKTKVQSDIAKWHVKWCAVRKESTFFYCVSSFVNADILTEGFFTRSLTSLGLEEFKSAVLSLKVNITKGEQFYTHLGEHHFFDDGQDTDYYMNNFVLTDEIQETSDGLRYINPNQKLEIGMDFGSMLSLIVGQHRQTNNGPGHLNILKEFYTLAPFSVKALIQGDLEMALKFPELKDYYPKVPFLDYFQNHRNKEIDFYYDRSGNQQQDVQRDYATDVKNAIEYKNGMPTGWRVNLISKYQSTIWQAEEYIFAQKIMSDNSELPKLRIDRNLCRCLKSSLELAKTEVAIDTKTGSKRIQKDKSSERKLFKTKYNLPMYSTNFSDAFKYFIYRQEWVSDAFKYQSSAPGMDIF